MFWFSSFSLYIMHGLTKILFNVIQCSIFSRETMFYHKFAYLLSPALINMGLRWRRMFDRWKCRLYERFSVFGKPSFIAMWVLLVALHFRWGYRVRSINAYSRLFTSSTNHFDMEYHQLSRKIMMRQVMSVVRSKFSTQILWSRFVNWTRKRVC